MSEPIEVLFPVEQDESGYPPVKTELIWCLPTRNGIFVVDNIPFYARDVSMGDQISAISKDEEWRFESLKTPSKNTTVRVFPHGNSIKLHLRSQIEAFGGLTEQMEGTGLIAVSFPSSADLAGALSFLDRESDRGNLAFEESAVRYR